MDLTLAEKITYLVDSGYNQSELATIIGCGQSMVSMMKTGYAPENKRLESKINVLYRHEARVKKLQQSV